ncbi:acyl-CoA thioesterase [Roseococcus sp. YIM B11640]|uniref:acyl-CoA thioesterase n=1 Tax=Roseococcus sp. YIM B11640 TaxID=3133973 RepID=UPI003C7A7FB4
MEQDPTETPRGELQIRQLAMPGDTNPAGDIFGGWVMAQMDAAGGIAASAVARGRVVTVAASSMVFIQPVKVGDVVCVYTDLTRIGRTSVTFDIAAWVLRRGNGQRIKVTQAEFTFVAVDEGGRPRPVPRD